MDVSNLILDITRRDQSLAMSLSDASQSHSTVRHYAQCSASIAEIRRLSQDMAVILNKAYAHGNLDAGQMDRLRKAGNVLWTHAVAPAVRDKLKAASMASLTIVLDEEFIPVPWELLYDGTDFLCLKFSTGRLVRSHADQIPQEQYRSLAAVPRMLVLANPTSDLQSAYQEGITIRNRLDGMRERLRVDFKSTAIDRMYVRKNLPEYDIVHFAGHCEFDPDSPEKSGWVLHDGRLTAADILSIGAGSAMPALIFSNSCHSATEDSAEREVDDHRRNYGVASAFLYSGVRHYIGAVRKIEDSVSAEFAREFYRFLADGNSVGESLRLTRLEMIRQHGIERILWAGYILYGTPASVVLPGSSQTRQRPAPSKSAKRLSLPPKIQHAITIGGIVLIGAGVLFFSLESRQSLRVRRLQSLFESGQNSRAIAAAQRMLRTQPGLLEARMILADTYYRSGDKEKALQQYFAYAFESEKQADKRHLSRAYSSIGWYYHLEGDFEKARDFYTKSIDLSRQNRDVLNEAIALRRLAVWYIDKKMYSRALEYLTRSSEINREHAGRSYEHRYHLACDYFDIGLVFTNQDDYDAARTFYNKSRVLFEKLRKSNELSDCWFNLGELYQLEKQYHKAQEHYMAGLKIDQDQGNVANLASDYTMIGELFAEMGRVAQAKEYYLKALELAGQERESLDIAAASRDLGKLMVSAGEGEQGCAYLKRAFGIYQGLEMAEADEVREEMSGCKEP